MVNSHRYNCLIMILVPGLLLCCRSAPAQQRIEHLLQAAEHLEKADASELASQVRELVAKEIEADKEQLLAKKMAELQQLEAEVAQLRQIVGELPQIAIHAKVVELNDERMHGGLGLVSFQSLQGDGEATSVVDEDGSLTEFFDFLKQQQMLKVLAEPSLITVAGRTASLQVGGEVPMTKKDASETRGLRLDCTPDVGDEGQIEIALNLQLSPPPTTGGSNKPPVADGISFKTTVELQSGQTAFLATPGKKGAEDASSGVLVLLRAELVNSASVSTPPGKTPPANDSSS